MFDDFNRGDFDAALAKIHADVDWGSPPDMPDIDEPWQGQEALYKGIERFMLAWEELTTHIDELREEGDVVVLDTHWVGRSKGTGIEVQQRMAQVYELRDGKVARVRQFRTFGEALAAAGLA